MTSYTIGFLQCQEHKTLPHMNMPLFVEELEAQGCTVECICANHSNLAPLLDYLENKRFDLFGIDYLFPYDFITRLKASTGAKIVVGGMAFFDMFYKTPVDFGIMGAGRQTLLMLVDALKQQADISNIPNLFYKKTDGGLTIDYTGVDKEFDLHAELFPYKPFLHWNYLGFDDETEEDGKANLSIYTVTVVAEFGCPHRTGKIHLPNIMDEKANVPGITLTERAQKRLQTLLDRRLSEGCTFCAYEDFVFLPKQQTVDMVLFQIKHLKKEFGFTKFAIGSEYPLRLLLPLINALLREQIGYFELTLRSKIKYLLKSKDKLLQALELSEQHGFRINIWQLGFEGFSQYNLDKCKKDQTVAEQHETIALLDDLEKRYPFNFSNDIASHGFVGVNPWTTVEEFYAEYQTMKNLPHRWRHASYCLRKTLHVGAIAFYDCFLPVYKEAENAGLLVRNGHSVDDYRLNDPVMEIVRKFVRQFEKESAALNPDLVASEKDKTVSGILEMALQFKINSPSDAVDERLCGDIASALDTEIDKLRAAEKFLVLAQTLKKNGDAEDALNMFSNALSILPDNAHLNREMAMLHFELKQYGRVLEPGRKATGNGLLDVSLHKAIAVSCMETGHFEAAIAEFAIAGEINPQDMSIHTLIGQCYRALGMMDEMQQEARKGVCKISAFRKLEKRRSNGHAVQ